MTSRERVLSALRREVPDRVPYCEVGLSARLLRALAGADGPKAPAGDPEGRTGGIDEMDARGPQDEVRASRLLGRDNVCFRLHPPIPATRVQGADGIAYYVEGLVRTRADLGRIALPDPADPELWAPAERLLTQSEGYATCLATRLGVSPVYLAMGTEAFSIALYEDVGLIEALLERYTDFAVRAVREGLSRGFDVVWTADDLAYKTGPLMSPDMFRRIVLPHVRKVADAINAPWVFHSDGDLTALMPDLLDLGITALNPIEPEAMDIREVKRRWGNRVCLVGNVSVHLLASGTPDDVRAEVRRLIAEVAPGGGYVLASGNSLASYVKPENVRAMTAALSEFGAYG